MKDAIDDLETAPSPDEGRVTNVDFEYENILMAGAEACQECGAPVDTEGPHIRATVWVEKDRFPMAGMKRPAFCSRECWASWASQE